MTRTISEWVKSLDQLHYCKQIEVVCFYKRGIKTLMNDSRKMHTGAFFTLCGCVGGTWCNGHIHSSFYSITCTSGKVGKNRYGICEVTVNAHVAPFAFKSYQFYPMTIALLFACIVLFS